MGIHDRDYVRMGPRSQSGLGALRFVSFNTWLIIINVAVFLLNNVLLSQTLTLVHVGRVYEESVPQQIRETGTVDRSVRVPAPRGLVGYAIVAPAGPGGARVAIGRDLNLPMRPIEAFGHFSTLKGFFGLEVWRFVTFQFLHANFLHLFFNMFGLWVFGGMVEQALGFKRYAAFYLVCGIIGALTYLVLHLMGSLGVPLPGALVDIELYTPLVGASAGVFGVIMASAKIAPNAVVQLLFPPIPLPLKWFSYGYVAIAALNLIAGGANAGGDAAHLGGAAAGFFFIRRSHLLRDFFDIFGDSRRPAKERRRGGPARAEVDRILAKVANEGLHSLSDAEKRTLRQATEAQRTG